MYIFNASCAEVQKGARAGLLSENCFQMTAYQRLAVAQQLPSVRRLPLQNIVWNASDDTA